MDRVKTLFIARAPITPLTHFTIDRTRRNKTRRIPITNIVDIIADRAVFTVTIFATEKSLLKNPGHLRVHGLEEFKTTIPTIRTNCHWHPIAHQTVFRGAVRGARYRLGLSVNVTIAG
jgi:hypothetical protein